MKALLASVILLAACGGAFTSGDSAESGAAAGSASVGASGSMVGAAGTSAETAGSIGTGGSLDAANETRVRDATFEDGRDAAPSDAAVTTSDSSDDAAPPPKFFPSSLHDRLVLWLEANVGLGPSGVVTTWADQSQYGNNAINSGAVANGTPTVETSGINGMPAVKFSNPADQLTVPDSLSLHFSTDDLIACVVLKHQSDLGSEGRIVLSKQSTFYPYVGLGLFMNQANTREAAAQLVYGQILAVTSLGNSLADNRPRLFTFNRAGGTLELRVNGAAVASTTAKLNGASVDLTNPTDLRIGGQGAAYQTLKGSIAEIVIVRGVVAPAELRDLESYLTSKYQL